MKQKLTIAFDKEIKTKIDAFVIPLPIYRCNIKILDKKNTLKLNKLWNQNIVDYDMSARNDLNKSSKDILIKIIKYSKSSLIHELYHCVDFIFEHIGEDDKPYSCKEARAYLMGYLFEEVMKIEKYLK